MPPEYMDLKILLPHKVFVQKSRVRRMVVMTHQGAFGILPNRLDCVASLSAGILEFEVEGESEVYIAVDEGVMVKTGFDVFVSVRNAIGGMALSELRAAVEQEFVQVDEQEERLRSVLKKMESGLIRRLASVHADRA